VNRRHGHERDAAALDFTSLHRGYVGCATALADSLLVAISARVAESCSPWVNWLLVDRRGLQGNFHVPTPFARRLHAGDAS